MVKDGFNWLVLTNPRNWGMVSVYNDDMCAWVNLSSQHLLFITLLLIMHFASKSTNSLISVVVVVVPKHIGGSVTEDRWRFHLRLLLSFFVCHRFRSDLNKAASRWSSERQFTPYKETFSMISQWGTAVGFEFWSKGITNPKVHQLFTSTIGFINPNWVYCLFIQVICICERVHKWVGVIMYWKRKLP